MKRILLLLFFWPACMFAQQTHHFLNDTLYTSCGYKIFKGQTLRFGNANEWIGYRFITLKGGAKAGSLENNSVLVKGLSRYSYTPTGTPSIDVKASIVYKDGSKGTISMTLAFDQAIGKLIPGISGELIVPEEFHISKDQAQRMYMPAFEHDTLYTSCGFKIYKGQVLQFGKMQGHLKFKYVNIKDQDVYDRILENRQLQVKELKEFGISVFNNAYITIIGTILNNNSGREKIEIHMAFDHAIGHVPGTAGELVVPDEYKGCLKKDPPQDAEK